MRVNISDSLSERRSQQAGKTPLLVLAVLALAIGLALCLLYRPWNLLRYGSATPPLPASSELEAPLSERIQTRIAAVREHPYDATAWGQLGETYDVHQIFPQAIVCYERAQLLAPEEARWPYWLGIGQRVGNQSAALACFERTIALAPDWAAAHFYAGHGYLSSERLDDAVREFERALQLEPEAPAALIGLAKVALSRNDPKQALEYLERANHATQRTQESRWLMAAAWRALGDEAKAQTYSDATQPPSQEPFPDKLRAELLRDEGVTLIFARQRADAYFANGEKDRAIAELQSYVEKVPKSAPALVALGDLYMRAGKPEDAIARYQAACTLDGTLAAAFSQWGSALARTGKVPEGAAKLRQALALEPSKVEYKSDLGAVLCGSAQKEEREEGLRLLGEVAQARPEDPSLRLNFAQALRANGRPDEAVAAFQRALDLAPNDVRMRFEFGMLCATSGHMEEAAAAFGRVVELDQSQMSARLNHIRALNELGRYKQALAALRTARELDPKSVEIRAQIAWILSTSPDDATRSAAEGLALAQELARESENKNPEMLVILAAAEAESGDLEGASVTLDGALELLKPKAPEPVSNPAQVAIIDRALAMRKAFKAGKPFRMAAPQ